MQLNSRGQFRYREAQLSAPLPALPRAHLSPEWQWVGEPCSPPSWPNWKKLAHVQGASVSGILPFAL